MLECQQSRKEGFTGKIAIHPSQVEVINACFTPTQDEVNYAGRMLDYPHLKQAQKLLERVLEDN